MYSRVPIFVLTALNGIDSRIKGLNAGADAVISKPYSPAVLLARIEAVLRRMDQGRRSRDGTEGIVTIGDITLDEAKFKVWVREVDTKLTKMEFRLLSFLMNHPDRPLDKTRLLEKVWHYSPNGAATSNTTVVEVTVSRLRRKIEQDPANPAHVITVEKGYMFNSGYS
jgi:two-component system response regulator RegX3